MARCQDTSGNSDPGEAGGSADYMGDDESVFLDRFGEPDPRSRVSHSPSLLTSRQQALSLSSLLSRRATASVNESAIKFVLFRYPGTFNFGLIRQPQESSSTLMSEPCFSGLERGIRCLLSTRQYSHVLITMTSGYFGIQRDIFGTAPTLEIKQPSQVQSILLAGEDFTVFDAGRLSLTIQTEVPNPSTLDAMFSGSLLRQEPTTET